MSETAPRIRWHAGAGADITAWFGLTGTVGTTVFKILRPSPGYPDWALTAQFPGTVGQARYEDDAPDAADKLKAAAERWLEEYISSLGAVFPEPDTRWQPLKDYLTRQIEQDSAVHREALAAGGTRAAAPYGGLVSANRSTLARMRELEAGQ